MCKSQGQLYVNAEVQDTVKVQVYVKVEVVEVKAQTLEFILKLNRQKDIGSKSASEAINASIYAYGWYMQTKLTS